MKAVVLGAQGGSENFRDEEFPDPPLRDGDVRIRMRAASFNPVDCQIRRGGPEGRKLHSMILGRDLAGVVDAVASDVTELRPGDEVYSYVCTLASSGTYAELVSVPAELVARKPASLSFEQAAAVPVAAITAWLALQKVQPDTSKSLFVAGGAGGVGTFALAFARQLGLTRIVTTAGNPASRAYLLDRCGLREEQVLDYKSPGYVARAFDGNGGGFDCVLDLVGGSMLPACCELLAIEGNLASVVDAPDAAGFNVLFDRNASFHPVGANAYSLTADRSVWRRYRELLDRFARALDGGTLAPSQVHNVGPLSASTVRRAHELLERGSVQGKLVMGA